MSKTLIFNLLGFLLLAQSPIAVGQKTADAIRLNQIGFYPAGPKIAIVAAKASGEFYLTPVGQSQHVFKGKLTGPQTSSLSGKQTMVADFSGFQQPGEYVLNVPGIGESYPFSIKNEVHKAVAVAALKTYYFQRMSTELTEQYAGQWHRPAGHPDQQVLIHPSAATKERPAGTVIASPLGWYDAGDYNKYIVNSGITVGTMLALYEDYPEFCNSLKTNIPESENDLPDLLDEALWNLRWMLTMQDPNDGGVYHKCTNAKFDGMVMPHEATTNRYVVQKSTAAALDFAAVMAQSGRVFAKHGKALPGFSAQCLAAAKSAWQWAAAHPAVIYEQEKMNAQFELKIVTGAYGDGNLQDERIWAAAELYATTGDEAYLRSVNLFLSEKMTVQSWGDVRTLAYFTLLRNEAKLTTAGQALLPELKRRYLAFAESLVEKTAHQAYLAPMESDGKNYVWGSSAVCANQGIALLYAHHLSGEKKYLHHALADLDYLLGRNATGYSFVTGHGSKTPMHIHHRPSEADGIAEPVPGLLAGGPNPGQQDKCPGYPNQLPDESYVDDVCSYASNEVAINWNAPLVYLAAALEAIMAAN